MVKDGWVKPDFASHGFVRVRHQGGSSLNEQGFREQTIYLHIPGKGLVATLRYQKPPSEPYAEKHFVTTESYPVIFVVDGGDLWLGNGRNEALESDLHYNGGFAHYKA